MNIGAIDHGYFKESSLGGRPYWTFKESYQIRLVGCFKDMIVGHSSGAYMGDYWVTIFLPGSVIVVDIKESDYLKLWERGLYAKRDEPIDENRLLEIQRIYRQIGNEEGDELITLARLGLWAKEHAIPALEFESRYVSAVSHFVGKALAALPDMSGVVAVQDSMEDK